MSSSVIYIIYIPIWLDLLLLVVLIDVQILANLHSNMVRFIINTFYYLLLLRFLFTFQYG